MQDFSQRSPFVIYRIREVFSEAPQVETILAGDGELISGVSVAQVAGDKLLVGSIFQSRMLECELAQLLPLK
jgi:hypothetical protein